MSEDKVGYAEGIDRMVFSPMVEARLNIINATLNFFNKKIDELERRVKELEDWR